MRLYPDRCALFATLGSSKRRGCDGWSRRGRAGRPGALLGLAKLFVESRNDFAHELLEPQCRDTDQASAGLVMDLKERGLLDDTLVIWGGEFGRTIYSQGALTAWQMVRASSPSRL